MESLGEYNKQIENQVCGTAIGGKCCDGTKPIGTWYPGYASNGYCTVGLDDKGAATALQCNGINNSSTCVRRGQLNETCCALTGNLNDVK